MLTKVAREARDKIVRQCEGVKHDLHERHLKVYVEIHEDWFFKNGKPRQADIANREKFIVDSIFKGLGIDDRWVWDIHMKKIDDCKEFALVRIEELRL